ncbi:hypothetical protein PMALA_025080 [Plasmodium malariae]|uniref:Uncharacterized protein n=1 Tax=Plasmodium malariae TaxID=5858 RepID=A0A1A8WBT0_PLAMA|nr:hypothetical protein PMALA_025080 [Plasmodium malariae]
MLKGTCDLDDISDDDFVSEKQIFQGSNKTILSLESIHVVKGIDKNVKKRIEEGKVYLSDISPVKNAEIEEAFLKSLCDNALKNNIISKKRYYSNKSTKELNIKIEENYKCFSLDNSSAHSAGGHREGKGNKDGNDYNYNNNNNDDGDNNSIGSMAVKRSTSGGSDEDIKGSKKSHKKDDKKDNKVDDKVDDKRDAMDDNVDLKNCNGEYQSEYNSSRRKRPLAGDAQGDSCKEEEEEESLSPYYNKINSFVKRNFSASIFEKCSFNDFPDLLERETMDYIRKREKKLQKKRLNANLEALRLQYIPINNDKFMNIPREIKENILALFACIIIKHIDSFDDIEVQNNLDELSKNFLKKLSELLVIDSVAYQCIIKPLEQRELIRDITGDRKIYQLYEKPFVDNLLTQIEHLQPLIDVKFKKVVEELNNEMDFWQNDHIDEQHNNEHLSDDKEYSDSDILEDEDELDDNKSDIKNLASFRGSFIQREIDETYSGEAINDYFALSRGGGGGTNNMSSHTVRTTRCPGELQGKVPNSISSGKPARYAKASRSSQNDQVESAGQVEQVEQVSQVSRERSKCAPNSSNCDQLASEDPCSLDEEKKITSQISISGKDNTTGAQKCGERERKKESKDGSGSRSKNGYDNGCENDANKDEGYCDGKCISKEDDEEKNGDKNGNANKHGSLNNNEHGNKEGSGKKANNSKLSFYIEKDISEKAAMDYECKREGADDIQSRIKTNIKKCDTFEYDNSIYDESDIDKHLNHGVPTRGPEVKSVLLRDLITTYIMTGNNNARIQLYFQKFAKCLKINELLILRIEENLAADLINALQASTDETSKRRKIRRMKIAAAALGGGALIAFTAGLAAPGIIAGLTALGAGGSSLTAFLASASGLAFIVSLFGAGGAGLTGYKYSRRIANIRTFEFIMLNGNISKSLSVCVCVSGEIKTDDDITTPWLDVFPNCYCDLYGLKWENHLLKTLGSLIETMLSQEFAITASKIWLQYTIASTLSAALTWPLALIKYASNLDNVYLLIRERAQQAGRILADALSDRNTVGQRPVILIGYSVGARVIFYCLKYLYSKKLYNIVSNAIFIGLPATTSSRVWEKIRMVVTNRVINVYSKNDWLLGFLYRYMEWKLSVAGLISVKVPNIENYDASGIIHSHLDYKRKLKDILNLINFDISRVALWPNPVADQNLKK